MSSGFYFNQYFTLSTDPIFNGLTFSDNICEDECTYGTMVYTYPSVLSNLSASNTLTIQNSSFLNNTAPIASAFYVEE